MKEENRREKLRQILNDAQLHHLMHKIVDIILSYTTQNPSEYSRPYLRFNESAYIDAGVSYCEPQIFFANGQPQELVTPWGGWECFDTDRPGQDCMIYETKSQSESYGWQRVLPRLTKRLGLEIVQSWEEGEDNEKVKWTQYTISKADDESLSRYFGYESVYQGYGADFDVYDSMASAWKSLEERYASEREFALYPGLETSINDASLHEAAHRVASIILNYAAQDKAVTDRPLLQDTRFIPPHSKAFHNGLRLSFLKGEPYSLYTPWGIWKCFGSSARKEDCYLWDSIFPELRRRFGLYAVYSDADCELTEYALTEIDGELLPKCSESDYCEECSEYIAGKIDYAWNRLERRRSSGE
jgi:hypothetical protein